MPSEIREWALKILAADTLEDKLFAPENLTDQSPGDPLFWQEPNRPHALRFQSFNRKKDRLPKQPKSAEEIAACLHRFCGHELLAVEMMAFALLAFPKAPKHFRQGLSATLQEEQWHVRLYQTRLQALGVKFGDLPLFRHFWCHTPSLTTLQRFITTLHLTLEGANLTYAPHYATLFWKGGDLPSATLMRQIFQDEVRHVKFGWHWLKKTSDPELSEWEAYFASLPTHIRPINGLK